MTGRAVRDQAHLVAVARQTDEDGGMNVAYPRALAGRYGSIGGVADHDRVNLVWVVLIVFVGGSTARRSAG